MSQSRASRGSGKARAGRGGPTVAQSLREYGRGLAGGMLFSLPLLFTMEVWWAGHTATPARLLANFCAVFVLLLGYNRFAGLRRDASWREVAIDSVEELGIGVVISALVLWLLGRITAGMPADVIVGSVVVESLTVAIGVSVGTAQLHAGDDGEDSGMEGDAPAGETGGAGHGGGAEEGVSFVGQVVIAFCGAVLFAANIAPTEEVLMLGAEISSARAAGLALFSLAFAALILYFSEFRGSARFAPAGDRLSVVVGTVVTYAVALSASALILWFFGRFDGQSVVVCLTQTVVLGVAATLGASAGRLLLQR
jgi:putative integral membrane protein (TIGR02587 family)